MLLSRNVGVTVCKVEFPRDVTGICVLLPTVMEEWEVGERKRSIPSEVCMWVEAPVSTQGLEPWINIWLEPRRLGPPRQPGLPEHPAQEGSLPEPPA